jgi:hypothetical protein
MYVFMFVYWKLIIGLLQDIYLHELHHKNDTICIIVPRHACIEDRYNRNYNRTQHNNTGPIDFATTNIAAPITYSISALSSYRFSWSNTISVAK